MEKYDLFLNRFKAISQEYNFADIYYYNLYQDLENTTWKNNALKNKLYMIKHSLLGLLRRIFERKPEKGKNIFYVATENHLRTFLPVVKKLDSLILFKTYDSYKKLAHLITKNCDYAVLLDFESPLGGNYLSSVVNKIKSIISISEEIIKKLEPKSLIISNEREFIPRVLVAAAKKRGIPTYSIQHGLMEERGRYSKVIVDRAFLWGKETKDFLLSLGSSKENIKIVGNTRLDNIGYNKNGRKIKNVLYASRKSGVGYVPREYNKLILDVIVRACNEIPEARLIIKPHPGQEDIFLEQEAIKKSKNKVEIIQGKDMFDVLPEVDLLITQVSTAGADAAVFGVPVITINLSSNRERQPSYFDSGINLHVSNADELKSAIVKCLYDQKTRKKMEKARKKFISDMFYKIDGKASERVAGFIKNAG